MKKILFLCIAAIGLMSCSSFKVASFVVDKSADYSKYKTFGYAKVDVNKIPKPFTMAHVIVIQQSITKQMVERGFSLAPEGENPDLTINLGVMLTVDKTATATTTGYGGGVAPYYWGARMGYAWGAYPWMATTQISYDTYVNGTLLFDLVDTKGNSMLWHGSVTKILDAASNTEKREQNLDKAMNALFDKFPVPAPAKK